MKWHEAYRHLTELQHRKTCPRLHRNINNVTPAQGRFQNACAIRMSYVLNKTGIKIPHKPGKTVSGGKGHWYLYKVKDLIAYLKEIKKCSQKEYISRAGNVSEFFMCIDFQNSKDVLNIYNKYDPCKNSENWASKKSMNYNV